MPSMVLVRGVNDLDRASVFLDAFEEQNGIEPYMSYREGVERSYALVEFVKWEDARDELGRRFDRIADDWRDYIEFVAPG